MADPISLPFQFSPNTLAKSSDVNADFNALALYINSGGGGSLTANGYIVLPGGIYLQWQTVNSVAADGSAAAAVTFPVAFPSNCFGVAPSIKNAYSSNPWALELAWDTPTVTGVNVNVSGAPPSQTVTLFVLAIGN